MIKMNTNLRIKPRRGFTLVELLMVIAIVGVLAAIIIPSAQAVRSAAVRTQCISNMRQVGVAVQMYANEHGGSLPKIAHGNPARDSWIYTLAPYLAEVDEVRVSPADPQAENKRRSSSATTYLMNDLVFLQQTDGLTGLPTGPQPNLFRLEQPSRTILAFTGAVRYNSPDQVAFSATNDHTHAGRWTSWGAVIGDISPNLHGGSSSSSDKTDGSSNYLFADGRVENFQAQEVKSWVDAGINIADRNGFRPPQN